MGGLAASEEFLVLSPSLPGLRSSVQQSITRDSWAGRPSIVELAVELGLDEGKVVEILCYVGQPRSLSEPFGEAGDSSSVTWSRTLGRLAVRRRRRVGHPLALAPPLPVHRTSSGDLRNPKAVADGMADGPDGSPPHRFDQRRPAVTQQVVAHPRRPGRRVVGLSVPRMKAASPSTRLISRSSPTNTATTTTTTGKRKHLNRRASRTSLAHGAGEVRHGSIGHPGPATPLEQPDRIGPVGVRRHSPWRAPTPPAELPSDGSPLACRVLR